MTLVAALGDDPGVTTLLALADAGDAIAATSSKLAKVRLLADFLVATDGDEVALGARYFTGFVFPTGDQRTLNVGGAAFSSVLRDVSGADDVAITQAWRRHSDAGDVTRDLLEQGGAIGAVDVTLHELDRAFAEMAEVSRGEDASGCAAGAAREGDPESGSIRRKADHRGPAHRITRRTCGRGDRRGIRRRAASREPRGDAHG